MGTRHRILLSKTTLRKAIPTRLLACSTRDVLPHGHTASELGWDVRHYWSSPDSGRKVSSRIYLQMIGTVCLQSAPSLLLFADSQRYIFNYGESLHRLICDSDICLDAGRIFLTGNHWKHIGGLGYVQYQPRAFEPYDGIQIYGPSGTADFVDSLYVFSKRHYITKPFIDCIDLQTTRCQPYYDDNVIIKPVLLCDNDGISSSQSSLSSYVVDDSICYIAELTDPPGKFLSKKAEEMGIPQGDLRKQLLAGNPVTLEDGRIIYPHDIIEPPRPGQAFGIIDCPTTDKLKLLVNNPDFNNHHLGTNNKPLDVLVHLTPQDIIHSELYQSWIKEFGPKTKHIVLNDTSSACQQQLFLNSKLQSSLHAVNANMFPTLRSDNIQDKSSQLCSQNWVMAKSGMTYNFRPFNKEGICLASKECEQKVYWRTSNFLDKPLNEFPDETNNSDNYSDSTGINAWENFRVTFLGTGASKVSRQRNTPSILLEWNSSSSLLLDCGDGTYCQLHHHYGNDTDRVLSTIGCVFVSHKHVDHHMGLVNLIRNRQKITPESQPLVIIGPEKLLHWLSFYNKRFYNDLEFRFHTFSDVKSGKLKKELRELLNTLELCKLSVVPVVHCDDSHGVVIAHASGWKIVYSGDCSPSGYLIREGAGADLLIHEATFLPDYGEEAAKMTGHSTVQGAIGVARRMRAHCTVLTHFSQRYNLKKILKTPLPPGVSVAFDHMTITRRDLPTLHRTTREIRRKLFGYRPLNEDKRRAPNGGHGDAELTDVRTKRRVQNPMEYPGLKSLNQR